MDQSRVIAHVGHRADGFQFVMGVGDAAEGVQRGFELAQRGPAQVRVGGFDPQPKLARPGIGVLGVAAGIKDNEALEFGRPLPHQGQKTGHFGPGLRQLPGIEVLDRPAAAFGDQVQLGF